MAHAKHGPRQLWFCLGCKEHAEGVREQRQHPCLCDGGGGVSILTMLDLLYPELSKGCSRNGMKLEGYL